jgi:hypothetical protein
MDILERRTALSDLEQKGSRRFFSVGLDWGIYLDWMENTGQVS